MIAELIERLKKAEGPDREIDQALWEAVTGECTHRNTHFVYLENDERELECSDCGADTYGKDKWSGLTSSLDAALSLVERKLPGWKRELEEHVPTDKWPHAVFGNHYWTATIISPEWDGSGGDWRAAEECGKTPALAVYLALLRALSAATNPPGTRR